MKLSSLLPLSLCLTLVVSIKPYQLYSYFKRDDTSGCTNDCYQAGKYLESHCENDSSDYNYISCICNINDDSFWSNLAGCECGEDSAETLDASALQSDYCEYATLYESYYTEGDYGSAFGGGGLGNFASLEDFSETDFGDETGTDFGATETASGNGGGSVDSANPSLEESSNGTPESTSQSPSSTHSGSATAAATSSTHATTSSTHATTSATTSSTSSKHSTSTGSSSNVANTASIGVSLYLLLLCLL
ncbi:hypothetical protein DFJ63DRAFT_337595 [Scheffersomyces coipomensis]|uniref:uncharacterized protein n=1 Tax=Scheffersomyces coipomensis TaxID=1788519 RepID=UPI00315D5265